jgi:hypothetical protein
MLGGMKRKRCTLCKRRKILRQFNRNHTRKDGLQSHCRGCGRKHANKYYSKNKATMIPMILAKRKERIRENQEKLFNYLSVHPCVGCGESDVIVLDFDHVRGIKRDHVTTLLTKGNSWETILTEIAKCKVRCANCHRRKTAKELKHYRYTLGLRPIGRTAVSEAANGGSNPSARTGAYSW